MTPAYLQNQLEQSLRNMNIDCVDVYYVHNPESQLGSVSEEEFYSRLRAAFERLEQNIAQGKIKMYGVATWNGFRVPPEVARVSFIAAHGGTGPGGRGRVAWFSFYSASLQSGDARGPGLAQSND